MKSEVNIQGTRLILRSLRPEDADFMLSVENNPLNWQVSSNATHYVRQEILDFIDESSNRPETDGQLRLLIETSAEHQPVGFIDLTDFDERHQRAEVGILVVPAMRRQGIGGEALQMLVQYAFEHHPLHQLYAYVPASNAASEQLFRSAHFVEAGRLKDWLKTRLDGFQEVLLMQRIKE